MQQSRIVYKQWARDPEGPPLPRNPPLGKRLTNGLVWGHTVNDFFWLQRVPGINVVTIWSRSMIEDFGENYLNEEHDLEPMPFQCHPYSWLRLPPGILEDPYKTFTFPFSEVHLAHGCVYPYDSTYNKDNRQMTIMSGNGETSAITEISSTVNLDSILPLDPKGPAESSVADDPTTDGGDSLPKLDLPQNGDAHPLTSPEAVSTTKPNVESEINGSSIPDTIVQDTIQFQDTPKLEEKIPEKYFPDILLVNDPECITLARTVRSVPQSPSDQSESMPKKYRRVYPRFERDTKPSSSNALQVAHLNLSRAPLLGTGHHSYVHRASLRLPPPLTVNSPTGEVTVAAKVALQGRDARYLLDNEAKIYNAFPEHLMQHWCGLNIVPPIKEPVPVGAVVPRFYGFYQFVEDNDSDDNSEDSEKSESDHARVKSNGEVHSPILLLEECGCPIEPQTFSREERTECFSLLLRLHYAHFVQNSFYIRNIMVQPGPLTHPPSRRSDKTPSFRIIDFGRAECWAHKVLGEAGLHDTEIKVETEGILRLSKALDQECMRRLAKGWWEMRNHEVEKARNELLVEDFDY